jgi:F-type H+-transporting ATPase subunit delta
MDSISLARPYAEAIFAVAIEENLLNDVEILLENICCIIADPDAYSILSNSSIDSKKKIELFMNLIKSTETTINKIVENLITNNRIELTNEILELYKKLRDEKQQQQEVIITSAQELTKKQQKQISENIAKEIKKEVNPIFNIDHNLIGGMTVKINDTVIDHSTAGLLNQLKHSLKNHEDYNHATT